MKQMKSYLVDEAKPIATPQRRHWVEAKKHSHFSFMHQENPIHIRIW